MDDSPIIEICGEKEEGEGTVLFITFRTTLVHIAMLFKDLFQQIICHIILFQTETVGAVINTISSGVVPKQATPPTKVVMEPLPLWQLANAGGYYFRLAGVLGASAVALGAYGAHCK